MCHHVHAHFVLERCGERRRVFGCYRVWASNPKGNFGYSVVDTVVMASCQRCGAILSLGPSNDDIPLDEIAHATFAKSDGYWALFDDPDAHDWIVGQPLAEQWPWGPPDPEHIARGDAMLDELIEEEYAPEIRAIKDVADTKPPAEWQGAVFAAVDTASREPWCADGQTQLSDACDAAVDACDRVETKVKEMIDAFAELVTVVPDGAA